MKLVGLDDAAGRSWDCIIVGSSFSAMFFARGLGKAHKGSVLFIERGPMVTRDEQLADHLKIKYQAFSQENASGRPKDWTSARAFGGNSNCWAACTPRFHPNDFRTRSLYGRGVDWPLSYDDLDPWWQEVEEVMEVSGGGSDAVLPRSRPFPFPAHAPSYADVELRKHDAAHWFAQPTARANGGRRPTCCANSICQLCPVDAKFTILNGLEQFNQADSQLLLEHEVRRVVLEAGRATGVQVRDGAGREVEIKGSLVVLAANPISNVAILLRSGCDNPRIGKGLVEQVSQEAVYGVPFMNYYGGTMITGHGYPLYDGPFRKDRGGVVIEVRNDMRAARRGRGKWLNSLRLKYIAEDIPSDDNRVVLKDDEPHILWRGHSQYAFDGLKAALDSHPTLLPFAHDVLAMPTPDATESHIQGMTPMAAAAADGVVDPDCAVFGVAGLRAIGASVFPTCSAANPTLTAAAIALRAGAHV